MDYNIDIFARDILYRMNKSDKVEFVSRVLITCNHLNNKSFLN